MVIKEAYKDSRSLKSDLILLKSETNFFFLEIINHLLINHYDSHQASHNFN